MKRSVSQIAHLGQRFRNRVTFTNFLGTSRKCVAKRSPKISLKTRIEERRPKTETQLGDQLVRGLRFTTTSQIFFGFGDTFGLPKETSVVEPPSRIPPRRIAKHFHQPGVDAVAQRYLKHIQRRQQRFGNLQIMRIGRGRPLRISLAGDRVTPQPRRRKTNFQFTPLHAATTDLVSLRHVRTSILASLP